MIPLPLYCGPGAGPIFGLGPNPYDGCCGALKNDDGPIPLLCCGCWALKDLPAGDPLIVEEDVPPYCWLPPWSDGRDDGMGFMEAVPPPPIRAELPIPNPLIDLPNIDGISVSL